MSHVYVPAIEQTLGAECENDKHVEIRDRCHSFPDLGIIPEHCDGRASELLWHERLALLNCWTWRDRVRAERRAQAIIDNGTTTTTTTTTISITTTTYYYHYDYHYYDDYDYYYFYYDSVRPTTQRMSRTNSQSA